jgi:hypothetical protein
VIQHLQERLRLARRLLGQLRDYGGLPGTLLLFGTVSYGDDLLCTAVFHELKKRGRRRLWMMSRLPELFAGNPDVDRVLPIDMHFFLLARYLGRRAVQPYYNDYRADEDRDCMPPRHLIAEMCRLCGMTGPVALRPYLVLTENEVTAGRLAPRQVAIQSSGGAAHYAMRNKEWFPERYQEMIDHLRDRFDFVQVGSPADPPLVGVLDRRGTPLRTTAAILRGSLAFVGHVGFLMHLARAVDCRSVIIYGGREDPAITGYPCNENLFTPLDCAPCGLRNRCPYDRECLNRISADHAADALLRVTARQGEPLETAVAQL